MLFLVIAGKDGRDGVNGDVHYFIKIILLVIKVAECGQQRLNVKMLSLRSSAVLCVVVKIYVITSDIRSKCTCSKCVRCIPYILCGSLNEWLHTCQAWLRLSPVIILYTNTNMSIYTYFN